MRFIDINTIIGPYLYGEQRFTNAEGLLDEMNRLGIERAFCLHTASQSYDPRLGNELLAAELAPYDRLYGAMVLTPLIAQEFGGLDTVRAFAADHRIAAIRLYPKDHNYYLDLWNAEDIFHTAIECRLPVFMDMRGAEGELGDQYSRIYTLAQTFPSVPLVLLTVGYRHTRVLMKLLEKCPSISIDTSTFIDFRGIEDIVKHFGAERILFGSRMPRIEGGVSIGRVLYADITESDKRRIACENALALLQAAGLNGKEAG